MTLYLFLFILCFIWAMVEANKIDVPAIPTRLLPPQPPQSLPLQPPSPSVVPISVEVEDGIYNQYNVCGDDNTPFDHTKYQNIIISSLDGSAVTEKTTQMIYNHFGIAVAPREVPVAPIAMENAPQSSQHYQSRAPSITPPIHPAENPPPIAPPIHTAENPTAKSNGFSKVSNECYWIFIFCF